MARRRNLRGGEAARSIEILGNEMSAGALALRTYAARQQLPHTWVEIDTPAGAALARAVTAAGADLPVVITPTAVLRHATPALLTGHLGLSYQPVAGLLLDLTIVGAGPAGLAAAVYGASEGLRTLLLDAVAAGGQAAASSRIENYLGFASGISGAELTGRAAVQAQKFGARIASPSQAARLDTTHERLRIMLTDDTTIEARAVVIATGARYRSLPLDRESWTLLGDGCRPGRAHPPGRVRRRPGLAMRCNDQGDDHQDYGGRKYQDYTGAAHGGLSPGVPFAAGPSAGAGVWAGNSQGRIVQVDTPASARPDRAPGIP